MDRMVGCGCGARLLRIRTNKIVSLWGTAQDITARKKNENELVYLSVHDHLTGLYNRRFFEQELRNLDTPENLPLSIIMCDVNGLKLINDSLDTIREIHFLKRLRIRLEKYVVKQTSLPESEGTSLYFYYLRQQHLKVLKSQTR